jgi:hypothetical protein
MMAPTFRTGTMAKVAVVFGAACSVEGFALVRAA